ncbi:hypothetical protein BHM03_00062651 [Ensete ventricosum]|nr:hypothetical protein BHM03_00062651 [Ensete ventricosum]
MSQRVPSWDVDDPPFNPSSSNLPLHRYHPSGAAVGPLYELLPLLLFIRRRYEVTELTWENGQLALHGLVPPRAGADAACSKHHLHHHPGGTLESVVNQATGAAARSPVLEDWLRRSASVAVDALVPCQDDVASNRIGDPDAPPGCKRAGIVGVCSSQGSAAGSLPGRVDSTTFLTLDTWRKDDVSLTARTTTATTATATNTYASAETENKRLGKRKVRALYDHVVSISNPSSQTKKGTKREVGKPSAANKKSRTAAVHNQSERAGADDEQDEQHDGGGYAAAADADGGAPAAPHGPVPAAATYGADGLILDRSLHPSGHARPPPVGVPSSRRCRGLGRSRRPAARRLRHPRPLLGSPRLSDGTGTYVPSSS